MKLFGTDGIRGIFGDEKINPEMATEFGKAMAAYCRKRKAPLKIIIGRDNRQSGMELEEAIIKGINLMGGDVILAGIIPTPALAYLVQNQEAGAGIVISASHNPYDHNGFKPFNSDGTKFSDDEESEVERYILEERVNKKIKNNLKPGGKSLLSDAKKIYEEFILNKISSNPDAKDFKLVLDCANGATSEVAPEILGRIVKNVKTIFAEPNGININDNCGSQYIKDLEEEVVKQKANLGLAFDGDGDRFIAIDEKGKALTGDQIIYIIAKMLKEKGELKNDLVVTTVMSNLGFINDLKKIGIRHITTPVGDRPVFFEMKKGGAVLGGEESGHIIYTGYSFTGDGIAGGILLLLAMNYFKKPLSELASEVTLFPKILVNTEVKNKPDLETIPEISDVTKKVENELGKEGRVLVRYSGTENLCRVMVEGRDEKKIKEYANNIANVIDKFLN